jgi:ribosome-associated protein
VTASDHALELATVAARAASGKLASDVVAIDVSEHLVITDVFVLASAPNDRQVKAIVEGVEEALNAVGVKPIRREGERDGRWVLLDFGELVVHVQHAEERTYYSLERLWKDCPTIPLPADVIEANNRQAAAAATDWSAELDSSGGGGFDRSGAGGFDEQDERAGDGSVGAPVSGVPGASGA